MIFCGFTMLLAFFPAPPGPSPGVWRVYRSGGCVPSQRQAPRRTYSVTRVAVFLDYQNLYHGARRTFGDQRHDPPSFGHVDPGTLARLLVGLGHVVDPGRVLRATNVYRGEPGDKSHRKLRSASARQTSRWRADPSLTVKTTPLRYRRVDRPGGRTWRAEEKGIDVLLAVDMVRGAYLDEFDAAVVASADTDLRPALQEILRVGKRVETASWSGPESGFSALRVPGHRIWSHRLRREHFDRVRDTIDYLAR